MEHFPPKVKIAPSGISLGQGGKKQSFVKDTILWGFNWAQSEFVAWPRREIFEKHLKDGSDIRIAPGNNLKSDNILRPQAPEKMAHVKGAISPLCSANTFLFPDLWKRVNPFPGPRGKLSTEFNVTHQPHSVFFCFGFGACKSLSKASHNVMSRLSLNKEASC